MARYRFATWNIEWFNALFDAEDRLQADDHPSSRYGVSRAAQAEAIALVLRRMDADAVLVVEAPDASARRSTVRALEGFAGLAGLRTRTTILGYANDTQQEIALMFDPARLAAEHAPRGGPAGGLGAGPAPRFDRSVRLDLDGDGAPDPVIFSKPPLELRVQVLPDAAGKGHPAAPAGSVEDAGAGSRSMPPADAGAGGEAAAAAGSALAAGKAAGTVPGQRVGAGADDDPGARDNHGDSAVTVGSDGSGIGVAAAAAPGSGGARGRQFRLVGVHVKSKAPTGARSPEEAVTIQIANRRKQLAQCLWLRARLVEDMKAGDELMVLGDFNDGPGLDEWESLFGQSGVEIVMGEAGPLHLYDPHARMALAQRGGAQPSTARFFVPDLETGTRHWLSALLDYIMISPGLRACRPVWRIWHPFDDPDCYGDAALRDALLTASDHFPVTLDLEL